MMLMLLTPSLRVTHRVPQARCSWSITQGVNRSAKQGKALRHFLAPGSIWHRGLQAAGRRSLGTAPSEDDTLSLCRRGHAGQHPGGQGRGKIMAASMQGIACLPFPGAAPSSWHAPALLCMSQVLIASLCPDFMACVTVTAQKDGKKVLLKGMKVAGTHRRQTLQISPA